MAGETRTALYLRVSTPDQKPDLQHDGLRGYAERAGLQVVGDYCDHAISGRRKGRPQLGALMTSVRNHEVDCVLVWKFDRFARSTRPLLTALEEFDHLGVRFISVQDQIDTASPMGRAMFTIIAAMAELESSLIGERVSAGMKAAAAGGGRLGRAPPVRAVSRDRAGMKAAAARGRRLGRPPLAPGLMKEIRMLAASTDLSIRGIHRKIGKRASRGRVGEITRQVRSADR